MCQYSQVCWAAIQYLWWHDQTAQKKHLRYRRRVRALSRDLRQITYLLPLTRYLGYWAGHAYKILVILRLKQRGRI